MWNARGPGQSRAPRISHGFTLIEVMVASGLVIMMSIALNYAVESTRAADSQLETAGRAALHGQRLTNDIASLVNASRIVYHDDEIGSSYLAACDFSAQPVAPGARLPVLDDTADLGADALGASHTGNILLLVTETTGSPCVADDVRGKIWTIDTYRLTAVYPGVMGRSITRDGAPARDVVIWRSEPFPSVQQIMEIPDRDERESVIDDLKKRYEFEFAWDPRKPHALAFFELDKDLGRDPPVDGVVIAQDPALSPGPRLLRADVRLAPTDPTRYVRRAVLTADEIGGWQPHGLEIKITGIAAARKVWVRTVVEASAQGGLRTTVHGTTTIADAHEY